MIRTAAFGDAPEIARLSSQLGYPAHLTEVEDRLDRLLVLPSHAVLVFATTSGNLGGYVAIERRLTIERGDRGEIVALVVDAGARRHGIGRQLVAAAEDWARGQGLAELFLHSNIVRPEAHAFYPVLGYQRHKTQHSYRKPLPALEAT